MGYLGYRAADLALPFAEFSEPRMAALPRHVVEALEHGPRAESVLAAFDDAAALLHDGDQPTEDGYGLLHDGGQHVSVRTDMPGVHPWMWTWWFGWHGSDDARYKLWHSRAHVSALDRWRRPARISRPDGRGPGVRGMIRISPCATTFVNPAKLGLVAHRLRGSVAVCARVGSGDVPVDVGWLVHHVRPTAAGSEMRSRFWLGGRHVAFRRGPKVADRALQPLSRPLAGRRLPHPRDLLVHCAREMIHLAAFLPALDERFGPDRLGEDQRHV